MKKIRWKRAEWNSWNIYLCGKPAGWIMAAHDGTKDYILSFEFKDDTYRARFKVPGSGTAFKRAERLIIGFMRERIKRHQKEIKAAERVIAAVEGVEE